MNKSLNIKTTQLWLDSHKTAFTQGSKEWLDNRKYKIGGSEIASIIGLNPYKSAKQTIREKIFPGKQPNMIKMHWGNLFEDIFCDNIRRIMGAEIIGTELQIVREDIPHIAYSPDGVAVMEDGDIVLCEFKCPFDRIPSGEIPEYYLPQVYTGMDVISPTRRAIYAEGYFRKCFFEDLEHTSAYNDASTPKDMKLFAENKPIDMGLFIVEIARTQLGNRMTRELLDETSGGFDAITGDGDLVDFAKVGEDKYKILFWLYGIGAITFHRTDLATYDSRLGELMAANAFIAGYLPWKLFRVDIFDVAKKENYIAEHKDRIAALMQIVTDCEGKNDEEKNNIFSSFFK